jgi:hypothetical protein
MSSPGDATSIAFRERPQQRDAVVPWDVALTPRGFSVWTERTNQSGKGEEYGYGYRSSG